MPSGAVPGRAPLSAGQGVQKVDASVPGRLAEGKLRLSYCDPPDATNLVRIVQQMLSDEICTLAAQLLAATQEPGGQQRLLVNRPACRLDGRHPEQS